MSSDPVNITTPRGQRKPRQDRNQASDLLTGNTTPSKPKQRQNHRRNKMQTPANPDQVTTQDTSLANPNNDGQLGEGASPQPSAQKSRRKKKTTTNQGQENIPQDPIPVPPPRIQRPNIPLTPSKPINQAYAGPTFHASPAPSALPIPKFFSRSAPQSDKQISLQSIMQNESPEQQVSSSEDNSPTLTLAIRAQIENPGIREASPLDLFFNADRRERARRQLESSVESNRGLAVPSPFKDARLQPSRPPTAGSVFQMEMGNNDSSVSRSSTPQNEASAAHTLESIPSTAPMHHMVTEEQTRAKSAALKQLLMSPRPQLPSSNSNPTASMDNRPSTTPSNRPAYNARSVSGSSTPSYTPSSSVHSIIRSPMTQWSPAPTNTRRTQPPTPSYLRQEFRSEPFPGVPQPSTPTTGRSYNLYNPGTPDRSVNVNASKRPSSMTFRPEDALRVTMRSNNMSVEVMEDELRKILKLDRPSGHNVADVRS